MSEFNTTANVSIEIESGELRDARRQIEDALSDVSLGLDASPDGSGGSGGGGPTNISELQTIADSLDNIESNIGDISQQPRDPESGQFLAVEGVEQRVIENTRVSEQLQTLDRTRNELLEEVVAILDDIEDQGGPGTGGGDGGNLFNFRRLLQLGALGGAGGAGGILGLQAALENFSVQEAISVEGVPEKIGVEEIPDEIAVEDIPDTIAVEEFAETIGVEGVPDAIPVEEVTDTIAVEEFSDTIEATIPDGAGSAFGAAAAAAIAAELGIGEGGGEPGGTADETGFIDQTLAAGAGLATGVGAEIATRGGQLASQGGRLARGAGGALGALAGLPANLAARELQDQNRRQTGLRGNQQLLMANQPPGTGVVRDLLGAERNATRNIQDFAEGSPAIGGGTPDVNLETSVSVGAPRINIEVPADQIIDETVSAFESEISDVEQDLQQQINDLERRIQRAAR